jgi:formamidopyrimidine-DNA glycosylase
MPELPEVEASRRELEARTLGRTILSVCTTEAGGAREGLEDELTLQPSPAAVRAALEGRRVTGTGRHGKRQWLSLGGAGPGVCSLHFGMGGALSFSTGARGRGEGWPPANTKLELSLDGGLRVALTDDDARRLARVRPFADAAAAREGLGVDALLELPSEAVLAGMLASTRPVKALLLDQSIIAGVGNYIADEVCYLARVHPATAAAAVGADAASVRALRGALADVVGHAVRANAEHARFPAHWLFHRRWNKGAGTDRRTLEGHGIAWSTVGGRITASVGAVQGEPLRAPAGARVRGSRAAAAAAVAAAAALRARSGA